MLLAIFPIATKEYGTHCTCLYASELNNKDEPHTWCSTAETEIPVCVFDMFEECALWAFCVKAGLKEIANISDMRI